MTAHGRSALLIGSNGTLGRAVLSALTSKASTGFSIPGPSGQCPTAHGFDTLAVNALPQKFQPCIVVCTSGAFASSTNLDDAPLMRKMLAANLEPCLLAAQLAQSWNAKALVLVGSRAVHASGALPLGLLHYGLSKRAVHELSESLNAHATFRTLLVLPTMIDTPANRRAMPNAENAKNWTAPAVIASDIEAWASHAGKHEGDFVNSKLELKYY